MLSLHDSSVYADITLETVAIQSFFHIFFKEAKHASTICPLSKSGQVFSHSFTRTATQHNYLCTYTSTTSVSKRTENIQCCQLKFFLSKQMQQECCTLHACNSSWNTRNHHVLGNRTVWHDRLPIMAQIQERTMFLAVATTEITSLSIMTTRGST
jgi:hypothetical protein